MGTLTTRTRQSRRTWARRSGWRLSQLSKRDTSCAFCQHRFIEHWKQLMDEARWTTAHIANYSKTSVNRSEAGIYLDVAQCFATLSN